MQRIIPYGKILLGNVFMGFAYAQWMKPHGIINGGVTSVSMIVNVVTKLPLLYLTNGITLVLLAVCWFSLGKGNFFRSCFSSVCYNAFFSLFYLLPFHLIVNLPVDFLLSCVCIAYGYYCCLSENASTVGMDVIALVLHKKRPRLDLAKTIRYINFIVLGFGLVTYGLQSVVIGVLFSYVNSFILGRFLNWHQRKQDVTLQPAAK